MKALSFAVENLAGVSDDNLTAPASMSALWAHPCACLTMVSSVRYVEVVGPVETLIAGKPLSATVVYTLNVCINNGWPTS